MNQATMSFPPHQVMGEGGINEPRVLPAPSVQAVMNSEGSALSESNVTGAVVAPALNMYNREAVRVALLSFEGGSFFGLTFIDALEDDEMRSLAYRLPATAASASVSFIDMVIKLEETIGISFDGQLTPYGVKAYSLLRDDEIVADNCEMGQRLRFLLKHGFDWPEGERPSADHVKVNPSFANKNGFDRFLCVTDHYYDPLCFGEDEAKRTVHGYYDDGDNKFWSEYTWNPSMSSFCTMQGDCQCFMCNAYSRWNDIRRRVVSSLPRAASRQWSKQRSWSTRNREMGERNHVLFGCHADAWLARHDNRSRAEKEASYTRSLEQNSNKMYYVGSYLTVPFARRRTITVRNVPNDIALHEIQALIGQATGVISVSRPNGIDGTPASYVEVVVPSLFGFRQYYQVLNVLTGSPVVIRQHTLEFVGDAHHLATTPAPRTGGHGGRHRNQATGGGYGRANWRR
jgi:hypothetical protein